MHALLPPSSPESVHDGEDQWCPQSSQHALALILSTPSLPMIGTIISPATGSAHHQPNRAFRSKPTKDGRQVRAEIRLSGIGLHRPAPDPGSNPTIGSRQHWHDHNGHGGNDNTGSLAFLLGGEERFENRVASVPPANSLAAPWPWPSVRTRMSRQEIIRPMPPCRSRSSGTSGSTPAGGGCPSAFERQRSGAGYHVGIGVGGR